jgi:hypothetical protein
MDYGEFSAERIKHLEMIQAVVARLGTDSFLVKGWAVTLSSALFGFAIAGRDWKLALLAVVPASALWGLDAYFLRAERLFRALFDTVRAGAPSIEPFFLGATTAEFVASLQQQSPRKATSYGNVFWSSTLRNVYVLLLLLAVGLALLLGTTDICASTDKEHQRHARSEVYVAALGAAQLQA